MVSASIVLSKAEMGTIYLNFNYENLNEDDAKSLGVWWDTD